MINLYKSDIELSIVAIFESLKTRYNCQNQELSDDCWNEFARSIDIPEISGTISRKEAYAYLDRYLKGGMESIQKITKFFNWNDIPTVESDLIKAEKIMEDAVKTPDIIDKIIENTDKIKKVIFKNNWFMAIIYDDYNIIDRIHISVENSVHKTKSGLRDFAEVGFYKDKICVNLDSHKKYNDNNGYNDLYDLYITNKEYDFSKYKNIAEQIIL